MLVDLVADTSELNCAPYWVSEAAHIAPVASAAPRRARRGEAVSFAMPRGIWPIMFASYAIFFAAMIVATASDGVAIFMVAISAGYTLMYFGTAAVLNRVDRTSRADTDYPAFDTLTGPMSFGAGFAQILMVPMLVATFGIAIAIIWSVVN